MQTSSSPVIRRSILPLLIMVALAIVTVNMLRKHDVREAFAVVPGEIVAIENNTIYLVDQGISSFTLYAVDGNSGKSKKVGYDEMKGMDVSFRFDRFVNGYCYYWLYERPTGMGGFAVGGGGGGNLTQTNIINLGTFRADKVTRSDPAERRTPMRRPPFNRRNKQHYRRLSIQGGAPEDVLRDSTWLSATQIGSDFYSVERSLSEEVNVEKGNYRWSEIASDRRVMVSRAGGAPKEVHKGPVLVSNFTGMRARVIDGRYCWIEPRAYPDEKADLFMMRLGDTEPLVVRDCYPAAPPVVMNGRMYWLQPSMGQTVPGVRNEVNDLFSVNLNGSDRRVEVPFSKQSISPISVIASNKAIYVLYKEGGPNGAPPSQSAPTYLGEFVPATGTSRRLLVLQPDVKTGMCDDTHFYYRARVAQGSLADAFVFENRENLVSTVFRAPLSH